MKVKCVKLYNQITQKYQDISYWLSVGKEYIVLEILVEPGKDITYRLIGDNENQSPGLYDARQFEVVSEKISSIWIITQNKRGLFIFGPKAWRQDGFWEKCYDLDPASLEIYKREATIIMREEGL